MTNIKQNTAHITDHKSITLRTSSPIGSFDIKQLERIKDELLDDMKKMLSAGQKISKSSVARQLKMSRATLIRRLETLEMTAEFDYIQANQTMCENDFARTANTFTHVKPKKY